MTAYTIITSDGTHAIEADRFTKDDRGDLYLYNESESNPVGHISQHALVGIFERDRGLA